MIKDAQKILVAVDDSKQAYQAFKKAVQVELKRCRLIFI